MRESCSAAERRSEGDAPRLQRGAGVPPQPGPTRSEERRTTIRRAADLPVAGGGTSFRLGDVYAEELERLRQQAHAEGFAAGHAEGMTAAAVVVAEAERAAAERLADVQARWERRLASADRRPRRRRHPARRGRRAGRRRGPRDDPRHGPHPRRGPAGPRAGPRRLPRPRRRPPCAHALPGRRPRRRPACTPTTSPRSPPRRSPGCPTRVRVVGDPHVERAGAVAETGARRIDAQLDGRPRAGPGGARPHDAPARASSTAPAPPPGPR